MLADQKTRQWEVGAGWQLFRGRSEEEEDLDLGHVGLILLHSSGSHAFSLSFLFTFEGRRQH